MRELYLLNVSIHVLAALVWVGGTLFLALVGAPVLRAVEPEALRARLFAQLGRRFRSVGWGALGALLVTGLLNLHFHRALAGLGTRGVWGAAWGRTLALKLALVVVLLALTGLHDFALGPRAGRLTPGTPAARLARSRAAWLARVAALLGVLIVLASVRLARGG